MTWISSYYDNGAFSNSNSWVYSSPSLSVSPTNTVDYPSLTYVYSIKKFSSKNNYQYITSVENFYTPGTSFSITTPWSDYFLYDNYSYPGSYATATPASPGNGFLHFYSSPTTDISSSNYAIYKANNNFGPNSEGLRDLKIYEMDFNIQGYSFFRSYNTLVSINLSTDSIGWAYYDDAAGDGSVKSYSWFDSKGYVGSEKYPCGPSYGSGDVPSSDFRGNNNLSKLIPYPFFNLSFIYQRILGGANDGISIYLSPTLPSTSGSTFSLPSGGVLVASLTQSGTSSIASENVIDAQFYGLNGNQYLLIVASTGLTSSATYSSIALSNLKIEGGYHPGNNRQYESYYDSIDLYPLNLGAPSFPTEPFYSTYVGTGNTINATQSLNVSQLFSKIGNGSFKAGVWENGVWNSGWRYDDGVYELYNVGKFYDYGSGKNWLFEISGPSSSISKFSEGDKVSISNIVAIDINENRRLIKNYFTIKSVNYSNTTTLASSNFIIVEFISNFPLLRIEKDSANHRIFITKNVWLSGAFLNGYFKGIWNYGLFKGYPLITEMFQSHWIDGIFEGGHFNATQLGLTFSDTVYAASGRDLRPKSKVGLTFSTPHKLNVGDVITIDKTNKAINPLYDGETTVIEVPNEYQIVTNIDWGSNSTMEGGSIYTNISNGLIQNFNFKSNNISNVYSSSSLDSDSVFVYNSWIDVNFNSHSAVNIGKPQTKIDSLGEYSENNLYGYPTNDVLSSKSIFRNSYSHRGVELKLGTKYKLMDDYIGSAGKFNDFFYPPTDESTRWNGKNKTNYFGSFLKQGWTYSVGSNTNALKPGTFSSSINFTSMIDQDERWLTKLGLYTQSNATGRLLDWYWPSTGALAPFVDISEPTLLVTAVGNGGVLDIDHTNSYFQPNVYVGGHTKKIEYLQSNRYTVVEFDLLTYSVSENYFELSQDNKYQSPNMISYGITGLYNKGSNYRQPVIHFNNINTIVKSVYYPLPGTFSVLSATVPTVLPATYLPIYQNVDHLSSGKYIPNISTNYPQRKLESDPINDLETTSKWGTKAIRKYEYFYNKRNIKMNFKGSGLYGSEKSGFILDNIKLFEIDMIPFFQYFIETSINKSVQIPYQGIAPFIDYTNSRFTFLDNISVGFDSVSIVSSSLPVSGVGVSIGGGFVGEGGTLMDGGGLFPGESIYSGPRGG